MSVFANVNPVVLNSLKFHDTCNPSTAMATRSSGTATTRMAEPTRVGDFNYLGCWVDSEDSRVFTDNEKLDGIPDLDSCAQNCEGFNYMGVGYIDQCKYTTK